MLTSSRVASISTELRKRSWPVLRIHSVPDVGNGVCDKKLSALSQEGPAIASQARTECSVAHRRDSNPLTDN